MEYNFIRSNREDDKELFFGPLTKDDIFIDIQENWTMAHILFNAGIFNSMSEAKRNNNSPIKPGFSDAHHGKNRTRITILNVIE